MIRQKDIIRNIDIHIIEKGLRTRDILTLNRELNTRIKILYSGLKQKERFETITDFIENINVVDEIPHNQYIYYNITHFIKRISDLKWMFDNKYKFEFDDVKLFGLIKLKDKLK